MWLPHDLGRFRLNLFLDVEHTSFYVMIGDYTEVQTLAISISMKSTR